MWQSLLVYNACPQPQTEATVLVSPSLLQIDTFGKWCRCLHNVCYVKLKKRRYLDKCRLSAPAGISACMLWVLLTLLNCSMYRASSVKGATWRSPLKNTNWKSFKVLSSHAPAGEHSAPGFQELLSVQERLQHPLVEQHVAHRLGYDDVHLDKKVRKIFILR